MFNASDELTTYLASGERVLWEGRSRRVTSAMSMGGFVFMFIFVLAAVVMFIVFAAVRSERNVPSALFVILPGIFLAVGLGVGIPLWVLGRQAGNTRYVVTSSAAMIVSQSALSGKRVTVVPLKSMSLMSLRENRDGTGTLIFGQSPFMAGSAYGTGWVTELVPAFWNIEQPLTVYQLIRKQIGGE